MFECVVGHVKCKISLLFPAILLLLLIGDQSGVAGISFLAACIHELGHITAAVWLRVPIKELYISIFGMRMTLENPVVLSYTKHCLIVFAGPFINALIALVFWLSGIRTVAVVHCLLAVFHLLPVYPLDGGMCLSFLLKRFEIHEEKQQFLMNGVFWCVWSVLAVLSLHLSIDAEHNVTLLIVCGYLLCLKLFYKSN